MRPFSGGAGVRFSCAMLRTRTRTTGIAAYASVFNSAVLFGTLCCRQKANVLNAAKKAIAAPAKSYVAIELNQSPVAPILQDCVRGCNAQYPWGAHEPSCCWRMCRGTLATAKKSERRLHL